MHDQNWDVVLFRVGGAGVLRVDFYTCRQSYDNREPASTALPKRIPARMNRQVPALPDETRRTCSESTSRHLQRTSYAGTDPASGTQTWVCGHQRKHSRSAGQPIAPVPIQETTARLETSGPDRTYRPGGSPSLTRNADRCCSFPVGSNPSEEAQAVATYQTARSAPEGFDRSKGCLGLVEEHHRSQHKMSSYSIALPNTGGSHTKSVPQGSSFFPTFGKPVFYEVSAPNAQAPLWAQMKPPAPCSYNIWASRTPMYSPPLLGVTPSVGAYSQNGYTPRRCSSLTDSSPSSSESDDTYLGDGMDSLTQSLLKLTTLEATSPGIFSDPKGHEARPNSSRHIQTDLQLRHDRRGLEHNIWMECPEMPFVGLSYLYPPASNPQEEPDGNCLHSPFSFSMPFNYRLYAERFSRKVFVGGLPPDIDEDEIHATFCRFGPLTVDWPHKTETKSYFPPKGYAFLLYKDESAVQKLIGTCFVQDGKYYICVSSPTMKDKPVQIRPWNLMDADYVLDSNQPLDPRKTVFVGGVPRPLRAADLAITMERLYGGVCYAGIDVDPELKYPKGAGRVSFSNQSSYIAAISARFVQLQHGDLDKRVEIKPYFLDDQLCDECHGIRSHGRFAPFFCSNINCLKYYCEPCWSIVHSRPGKEFHKPLMKENSDRGRGVAVNFRW